MLEPRTRRRKRSPPATTARLRCVLMLALRSSQHELTRQTCEACLPLPLRGARGRLREWRCAVPPTWRCSVASGGRARRPSRPQAAAARAAGRHAAAPPPPALRRALSPHQAGSAACLTSYHLDLACRTSVPHPLTPSAGCALACAALPARPSLPPPCGPAPATPARCSAWPPRMRPPHPPRRRCRPLRPLLAHRRQRRSTSAPRSSAAPAP